MTKTDAEKPMEVKLPPPPVAMTPEEFSMETRFVILNFMGLVPASNLGERVPLGASWHSSSSGSHRSASLHSRSSSSSSQHLPEFTDEQFPMRVSAHGVTEADLKKPLAKSRSLPKDETPTSHADLTHGIPRQPGGSLAGRGKLLKQLRKTKSVGSAEQFGPGLGRGLRRSERVDEESESPERESTKTSSQPDTSISADQVPSTTPTDVDKLFETNRNLSLTKICTDPSDLECDLSETVPALISKPHNGSLYPNRASATVSELGEHCTIENGPVNFQLSPDTSATSAFRFQGRSQSPCRPSTLDLSEDAPKSSNIPYWKVLVQTPAVQADSSQESIDQVDHFKSRSRVQSSMAVDAEDVPREGNEQRHAGGLGTSAGGSDTLAEGSGTSAGGSGTSAGGSGTLARGSGTPAQGEIGQSTSASAPSEPESQQAQNRPFTSRQCSQVSSISSGLPSPVSSALGESGRSWVSSRTSLSELSMVDVASLVNNNVLPPVAVPLKEELREQWRQLETTYGAAVQSGEVRDTVSPEPSSSNSPESEVARRLGIIGDQVQEEYGEQIEQAISGVLGLPRERLTYEVFVGALLTAGLHKAQIAGWKQVALVLLFSQRLALALLQKGERQLRHLVDLTARAINDRAAGFILDQGGWHSLSELEIDSPVSVSDIAPRLLPESGTSSVTDITPQTDNQTPPNSASNTLNSYNPNNTTLTPQSLGHDTPDNAKHSSSVSSSSTTTPSTALSGLPTPASSDTAMSSSPSDENSNKPLKVDKAKQLASDSNSGSDSPTNDSDSTSTTTPVPPKAMTVNIEEEEDSRSTNNKTADEISAKGHLTPEEIKSIEEAVTSVRQEIQLIRQVSTEFHNELEIGRHGNDDTDNSWYKKAATIALLATLGLAVVVAVRYRKGR